MEASGTPTPPADPPPTPPVDPPPTPPVDPPQTEASPPPPPPATPESADGKAGGGWRALGFVLFLALAFACAVMVIAMADIGDTRTCDVVNQELKDSLTNGTPPPSDTDCFDGSSGQKTASLVLGWPSGVLAGIAALVALLFVFTGRRGPLLLRLTGAAIVLGALSIGIGSI
jgi:hypothetical protein